MARHVSIEEPDGSVIDLELWPFQRDAVKALHDDKAIIVLKARRLGLSWVALSYALWLAIFKQGVRVLILCKTGPDAVELLDRIRRMRDRIEASRTSVHLLGGLNQPAKVRDAATTLDVGESTIKALMGTPAAARSETAGLVILDEFAFQRGAGEIWTAILPTIEGGGRLAVISTGNGAATSSGAGAEFAKQWSSASSGATELRPLFFSWQQRPDRDEAWRSAMIAKLGDPDRFRREYPATPQDAFVTPDIELVFDPAGIDAAERLGREFDELRHAGELLPDGDSIGLGIDWGENTHAVIVWPLEQGGVYVPPGEVVASGVEPGDAARRMLDSAAAYDFPLSFARYDAAGIQSMRTFGSVAPDTVTRRAVPFGKYKQQNIGYLRWLFRRAAQGHHTKVIAISPQNTELLRQLRGMAFADQDAGKVDKGDDHGPDALIAGVNQIASTHREQKEVA